jgi:hypothetical protein
MISAESIYPFLVGVGLFLLFWFLLERAITMRTRGRDLVSSGQRDLQSGRQKIREGKKTLMSGTFLLLAIIPLVILIVVALLRACATV